MSEELPSEAPPINRAHPVPEIRLTATNARVADLHIETRIVIKLDVRAIVTRPLSLTPIGFLAAIRILSIRTLSVVSHAVSEQWPAVSIKCRETVVQQVRGK